MKSERAKRPVERPGRKDQEAAKAAERAADSSQRPVMKYDEAMRLREKGELPRAVCTERGWVMKSDRRPIPPQGDER